MLYLTTRNTTNPCTAPHSLRGDRGPDGGFYVPFQITRLPQEKLDAMMQMSFGSCVAEVLNLFFGARMDSRDVEFCIGKSPMRLVTMKHKLLVGEVWHNQDGDFWQMVKNLSVRLQFGDNTSDKPADWLIVAVRIAVLFGIYAEALRSSAISADERIDVSLPAGDFTGPMAVWYAREMGLPMGTIVLCCHEDSPVWDLVHNAQVYADAADIPAGLERLIYNTLGHREVARWMDACAQGSIYSLNNLQLEQLRKGLYCSVVSDKRIGSVVSNVHSTSGYHLDFGSAMAFGGLQDYRAVSGEIATALLISEHRPVQFNLTGEGVE